MNIIQVSSRKLTGIPSEKLTKSFRQFFRALPVSLQG